MSALRAAQRPTTVRAALAALVEALPPEAVVPVPSAWLRELLGSTSSEPAPLVDLTCDEVGQLLHRTAGTVRGWCAAGRFPGAYRLGREWRIPRGAITAFQERLARGDASGIGSLGDWRAHVPRHYPPRETP